MRQLMILILVLGMSVTSIACKGMYKQRGTSEWGFKYQQSWAFYQETRDEVSSFEIGPGVELPTASDGG